MYGCKRIAEDCKQENVILKQKLQNSEQLAKTNGEQAVSFKISKEKFETQVKSLSEQLEMVTKSHDELIGKKGQELDLLRKDQGSTMLREKEMRQRLQGLEREYGEVRDALR